MEGNCLSIQQPHLTLYIRPAKTTSADTCLYSKAVVLQSQKIVQSIADVKFIIMRVQLQLIKLGIKILFLRIQYKYFSDFASHPFSQCYEFQSELQSLLKDYVGCTTLFLLNVSQNIIITLIRENRRFT